MQKLKRLLSVVLMTAMLATNILSAEMVTSASDVMQNREADAAEEEMKEETEAAAETEEKIKEQTEEIKKTEEETKEEIKEETEKTGKEIKEETKEETETEIKEETKEDAEEAALQEKTEEKASKDAEAYSLLPLEERKAYLVLNGKSEQELKHMRVKEVLKLLIDSRGNQIPVAQDAVTVWRYKKSEEDGIEEYERYSIAENKEMDLSTADGIKEYSLELIIGSDNQLDTNNIRYIVKVFVTNDVREEITYGLYSQDRNGNRKKVIPQIINPLYSNIIGIEVMGNEYSVPEVKGNEYYLEMASLADDYPYFKVEVYDFFDYISAAGSPEKSLTGTLMHQNMMQTGAGLKVSYDKPNIFVIVRYDQYGEKVGDIEIESFMLVPDTTYVNAHLYSKTGDKLTDQTMKNTNIVDFEFEDVESEDGTIITAAKPVYGAGLVLKETCDLDSELYCILDAHGREYGDRANEYVIKAVEGHYNTLEEAADCRDIKDQLIPADKNSPSRGYKGNYKNGALFTLFFEDGTVWKTAVLPMAYDPEYDDDYFRPFTEKPIVGSADPWLRVTGANGIDDSRTYVVENGKSINMDTYYGYGYQTVLIDDPDVDLTKLSPRIEYANEDRIYAVLPNTSKPVGGNHTRDFTENNRQYTGKIDNNDKNYWVTFKKLNTDGPELYVFGPDEREVILDQYFEFKHDILIANIGNAPLEEVSVALEDAEHVKLDSYWTVGQEGNNTLAAFSTDGRDSVNYGEMPNLAKIRLLPDGEGTVKGTLVITAKGQKPVRIDLNGTAKRPEIVTKELDEAVKYVPYQHIIATDNIHSWIDTKFSVVKGKENLEKAGISLDKETGELYGIPQVPEDDAEEVKCKFTVEVKYSYDPEEVHFDPAYADEELFEPSYADFELTVKTNSDKNVYEASDENPDSADLNNGYTIKQPIGTKTGEYSFELEEVEDTEFISYGKYSEFVDLWLNGERLEKGTDYDSESGSTKITIKSQTFNKVKPEASNTIAMEFRKKAAGGSEHKNQVGEVHRTSQNFKVNKPKTDTAVTTVINLISKIPSEVTLSEKTTVQSARKAYDALNAQQKAKVTNYSRLTKAEAAIRTLEQIAGDKAEADKVIALINAIPSKIDSGAEQSVKDAADAYNALTSAQKKYVSNVSRLEAAEKALADWKKQQEEIAKDKEAAKKVSDLIEKLSATVTLDDKAAASEARKQYNLLTASQKGYVDNYEKLQSAEAVIAKLEEAEKDNYEDNKEAGKVIFVGTVSDQDGKPLTDYIVEIHSTVQTARTDRNGYFRFADVEMGDHTITIKDKNGSIEAVREFCIAEGTELSLKDNVITAQDGAIFTVKIKRDGKNITFISVEEGDRTPDINADENEDDRNDGIEIGDPVNPPSNPSAPSGSGNKTPNEDSINIDRPSAPVKTGDNVNLALWFGMLFLSICMIIAAGCYNVRGKKIRHRR